MLNAAPHCVSHWPDAVGCPKSSLYYLNFFAWASLASGRGVRRRRYGTVDTAVPHHTFFVARILSVVRVPTTPDYPGGQSTGLRAPADGREPRRVGNPAMTLKSKALNVR